MESPYDMLLPEINNVKSHIDSLSMRQEGLTLTWRDLSIYVPRESKENLKRIINNVSGAVRPGKLVAVMGGSGAGKTTLMSALAQRSSSGVVVQGTIRLNGRPMDTWAARSLSAFLPQDDLLPASLTVTEHLTLIAMLRLGGRVNSSDRSRKVRQLLTQFGLSHRAHALIGAVEEGTPVLSGGEKRRLAFAAELLTDPELLFCDEPTTGLDSYSAKQLVSVLRQLAIRGRTVLCTIHQPSSDVFSLFDEILLLAAGGRVAFLGKIEAAITFFDRQGIPCPALSNPAEVLIQAVAASPGNETECIQTCRRLCDQFAVSEAFDQLELIIQYHEHLGQNYPHYQQDWKSLGKSSNYMRASFLIQIICLTKRVFLEVIRNPSVQFITMLQKIAIGLLVGFCYLGSRLDNQAGIQSIQGALFMFVTENTFSAMYSALNTFPKDKPLLERELKTGLYTPGVYYLSKIIALLPGMILDPLLFTLVCYWIIGLRSDSYVFLMTCLIAILTLNVAASCGTFFSIAFKSVPVAMSFLIPFDYSLMITSGLFIKLSSLPSYFKWIQNLSWFMYANEAQSIIHWTGVNNITCDSSLPCITNGEQVLEKYSFKEDRLYYDLTMMILLYFIFHILGYLCLLYRVKHK